MRKKIFILLTAFLPFFPVHASDFNEPSSGWNTRELITLYFHNSELQTQWAWEALSNYRIRGDENVLDFGSGDGKLSALLSYMVPEGRVTGVDISEQMILFARKMFPYRNLRFQLLPDVNFSNARFPEKFDLVTSFCVFHLVPNPLAVLKEIHTCMAPEGRLVITLPIGKNADFYKAVSEEMEKRGWRFSPQTKDSKQMRDPDKIQEVLSEAGFSLTYFNVVDWRFPFSSKEKMIDWFEGTLTANWGIPKEGRREFFTAVADRYLQCCPQNIEDDGFVYFSVKKADLIAAPI